MGKSVGFGVIGKHTPLYRFCFLIVKKGLILSRGHRHIAKPCKFWCLLFSYFGLILFLFLLFILEYLLRDSNGVRYFLILILFYYIFSCYLY